MGRWTQYDEDSYRLPEGMSRVGYDTDTGRYAFQDQGGSIWHGPQGSEYGTMYPGSHSPPTHNVPQDLHVNCDCGLCETIAVLAQGANDRAISDSLRSRPRVVNRIRIAALFIKAMATGKYDSSSSWNGLYCAARGDLLPAARDEKRKDIPPTLPPKD